ncbi:hypothetical protein HMPREF1992_00809 [Selenomonas sp. oral taxon 892 str. F0426]|nr:hypothetical protein HMPREF1992_00809 [Selenomonas sp. oral taxon 892 str. F0426]
MTSFQKEFYIFLSNKTHIICKEEGHREKSRGMAPGDADAGKCAL